VDTSVPGDQKILPPLPVYEMGLADIAAGHSLAQTRLIGWRYLILHGLEPIEAAEVSQDVLGELRFSHVNRGPLVAGTWKAIRTASDLKEVKDHDFELRHLRIPALCSLSLWMSNGQHNDDRLIPAGPPSFLPLQAGHVYTSTEFLRLLQPLAVSRLAAAFAEPGEEMIPALVAQSVPSPSAAPSSKDGISQEISLTHPTPQIDGGITMEPYLVMVRLFMAPPFGQPIEQAIVSAQVPEELREAVCTRLQEQDRSQAPLPRILSAPGGRRPWFAEWDPSMGYYWQRQRRYLLALGRTPVEIESLDNATDLILSHLEDPRPTGPIPFRIQGLVVGYIQSGKTANFSALIAKAADVGYKLVIILSGIHNALRQQTQRRLERELGLAAEGVGLAEVGRRWIAFTSVELSGDFRPGNANAAVLQGNERVLLVVKKNASVLRRLIQWMAGNVPESVPVLLIDDEADQASINTGGNRPPIEEIADLNPDDLEGGAREDELDPSVINGLIRQLISSFRRVSYVAYTATPFANVLINHEAVDRQVLDDLYPRDFIVSLPRPNGYVGPDRLFGRGPLPGEAEEVSGLDVINIVPDVDVDLLSPGTGSARFEPQLPASLQMAFLDFVLAIAGRAHRRGSLDFAASMLVHSHHRTFIQNRIGERVRAHLDELRQQWRYDRDSVRPALSNRWENHFRPLIRQVFPEHDTSFSSIEEQINRLFRDPLTVLILNSESDDVLDYDADPRLKAVLIGGNRLSRGLTLEGLLVSYFVRKSLYFDTLLQMGRWFGFREEYVDLTRLWTTLELETLFQDLALAEEELRREIVRYERERLTPRDFGPRIRCHPAMLVTAPAKMGSGRVVAVSYAGQLVQTVNFQLDSPTWLDRNLEATRHFLSRLGPPQQLDGGRLIWSKIDWRQVDGFLADYQTDARNTRIDARLLRDYVSRQTGEEELTHWWVCVVGQSRATRFGNEDLGIPGHPEVPTISRNQLRSHPGSIGTLVNPATSAGAPGSGDEEVGLTRVQQVHARSRVSPDLPLGEALRSERNPAEGLLLIYPISKNSRPRSESEARIPLFADPEVNGRTVIGIALVFPASRSDATLEYVEGSVNAARMASGESEG